MFANHMVYKGYRLSAHVHRQPAPEPDAGALGGTFYATLAIVAISNDHVADLPPVPSHSASNPREAMEAAVAYGRHYIDNLSTHGKTAVRGRA